MKRGWGLQRKMLLVSLCMTGVMLAALALLLAYERSNRRELVEISRQSQTELINNVTHRYATAIASQLADSVTNDLYYFDLESIGQQLAFAKQLPLAIEAIVYDAGGRIVHDGTYDISNYGAELSAHPLIKEALAHDETRVATDERIVEAAQRIRMGPQILGGVLARFDLDELNRAVTAGSDQLTERLKLSTWWRLSSLSVLLGGVVLLGLLSSWALQRYVVRPISTLATAARQIESGEYRSFSLDSGRRDEIGELERTFERMSERISESHHSAERKAYVDPLTGLPNRRAFDEALANRIYADESSRSEFALMFIDSDNLKQINDGFGHDAGDAALIAFAHRASQALDRGSFSTAWLARIGGDEFAALCEGQPLGATAVGLAEAIVHQLQISEDVQRPAEDLTVSIGIALYPEHASTATELLRCADAAMYRAKSAGKNRICVYAPETEPEAGEPT